MTDGRYIHIYKRKILIDITSMGLASARPNYPCTDVERGGPSVSGGLLEQLHYPCPVLRGGPSVSRGTARGRHRWSRGTGYSSTNGPGDH